MDKLKYTFEITSQGNYQVKLNGYLLCYVDEPDEKEVDKKIREIGFKSREEALNFFS
ncbi:MAG: hypothetical protein ACQEW2_17685 [Bacillota bacterium]